MATDKTIGVMRKILYRDGDGEIIASVKINPADNRLPSRLRDFAVKAKQKAKTAGSESIDALGQCDDAIADLFCELLGYDCRKTLFGIVSPTTVLDDGRLFAACVLEDIKSVARPELEKTARARRAAIEKHLQKYS